MATAVENLNKHLQLAVRQLKNNERHYKRNSRLYVQLGEGPFSPPGEMGFSGLGGEIRLV